MSFAFEVSLRRISRSDEGARAKVPQDVVHSFCGGRTGATDVGGLGEEIEPGRQAPFCSYCQSTGGAWVPGYVTGWF